MNEHNLNALRSAWGGTPYGVTPIADYSMIARSRRITAELAMAQSIAHQGNSFGMPNAPKFGQNSFGMPGAQTGVMVVDEQLQQQLYTSIISGAILTLSNLLLFGSGVVTTNLNVRYSTNDQGTTVYVPYFSPMGPVQTIAVDGDAGNPQKILSTDESNVVQHGYIGMAHTEMTTMFSPFGGQLQGEFSTQARVRFAEWADLLLVSEAMTKATAADVPVTNPRSKRFKTVYAASSPLQKFRRQLFIDSLAQRGAFGFSNMPAMIIVHTDVIADMMSVNDAIGNMNLVSGAEQMANRDLTMATTQASPTGLMLMPFNIPIAVSGLDIFKPSVSNGDAAKYRSLLLWPRALGWLQNPVVTYRQNENIHKPSIESAMHTYAVAHAYKRGDMVDLPGFFCIEHN